MNKLLKQLNQTPGVIGSFVCDKEGRMSAEEFPRIFDHAILETVAELLVEKMRILDVGVGTAGLLDLRFSDARVVIKQLINGFIVLLCESHINMQLLKMYLTIAMKKIDAHLAEAQIAPPVVIPVKPIPVINKAYRPPSWPSI